MGAEKERYHLTATSDGWQKDGGSDHKPKFKRVIGKMKKPKGEEQAERKREDEKRDIKGKKNPEKVDKKPSDKIRRV